MKKLILLLAVIVFVTGCGQAADKKQAGAREVATNQFNMKISSSAFENGTKIPSKYTCDGNDISPSLEIKDVPEGTKSLALIVDDPDAPVGIWVHWVVWNIDPATSAINENTVPKEAVQGVTSFGNNNYGGPCPPTGVHRYFFKLYALDSTLDLQASSDKTVLERAMEGHTIEKAELMGTYSH